MENRDVIRMGLGVEIFSVALGVGFALLPMDDLWFRVAVGFYCYLVGTDTGDNYTRLPFDPGAWDAPGRGHWLLASGAAVSLGIGAGCACLLADGTAGRVALGALLSVPAFRLLGWLAARRRAARDPELREAAQLYVRVGRRRLYKAWYEELRKTEMAHGVRSIEAERKRDELMERAPNRDEWRRCSEHWEYLEEKRRREEWWDNVWKKHVGSQGAGASADGGAVNGEEGHSAWPGQPNAKG